MMNNVSNQTGDGGSDQKPLIVVVDDEPMVGELVETIFMMEGWDAQVFVSPQKALEAICGMEEPPGLLLTDFRMPGMNGMELIQSSKKRFPTLKTVLFSGNVDESIQTQYTIKANAFLRKPFYPQVLLDTVKNLLDENGSPTGQK